MERAPRDILLDGVPFAYNNGMRMKDPHKALLLAHAKGVALADRKRLVDRYGSIETLHERILKNDGEAVDLPLFEILRPQLLRSMAGFLRRLEKEGAWVLAYGSADYPSLLSQIENPPMVLYGVGTLPRDADRFMGFVGPREPSQYGIRTAKWLAADLAREGLTIVSGLARGIDALAHEAAVRENAPTIAVMASGIDRTYPKEHALLRQKIEACGAVVTEFAPGEEPRKENFPRRNRIISGLCKGLLVIEAGERSGVRITVRCALSQGRDVYAVPGPIDAALSMVPNRLIAEGAKLVASSQDVLDEFGLAKAAPKEASKVAPLSVVEKNLLAVLDRDNALSADDLSSKGEIPIAEVLSSLSELEIKGLVERQPDARYVKIPG